MVILVDTNIIVDAVAERHLFAVNANIIIEKCARREITGFLAAYSISNLFYILRKDFNPDERRNFIKDLCKIFYIPNSDEKKILQHWIITDLQILRIVCRRKVQLK